MRSAPGAQPGIRQHGPQHTVHFLFPVTWAGIVPVSEPLRSLPQPTPFPQPTAPASRVVPVSQTNRSASVPAAATTRTPTVSPTGPRSAVVSPTGPRSGVVPAASAERNRLEVVLENVRAEVAKLRREEADRLRGWQRAAIELAMTIATRLLHERVVSGEFPMEAKVRDMVAQLGETGPVTIRLHPDDLDALTWRLGGKPLLPNKSDPQLVPDPALARGECQVEGKESMLLSDVTRELQDIRDELLRSLAHART